MRKYYLSCDISWQVQIYKVETNVHVKNIYRQIMNTIGSIPPESGGILG